VEPTRGGAQWASGYRPHLDGLRAVAVYLVLLFHAGSRLFPGGFVGVDVFFVLSGFLVTRLLMRDLDSTGSVRLRRFYARRFRRLLPAAFLALLATAGVYADLASPVEVADAEGAFRAAFLYVANWYFIAQSADYFGADPSASPVLHFWSLAVEEQFYLLWPLLLGGTFALTRRLGSRQRRALRGAVLLAAAASLAGAWGWRIADPNRAYYGTDTRAYQLMAGAWLALTPGAAAWLARRGRVSRWVGLVAGVALVFVASNGLAWDGIERGTAAAALTVLLIVALEAADGGVLQRALSWDPVVYLGKVSYGTYLWHWPVVLVLARSFELSTPATIAATGVIATALASLSFQLFEHPIRVSALLDRLGGSVIVTGLTVSVASALLVVPAITAPTTSATRPGSGDTALTGFTPVPTDLDFEAIRRDFPPLTGCYDAPASTCTLVQGHGAHILLIGDSHAGMMIPALMALAHDDGLTLSVAVQGGCPWQRDLYVPSLVVYGSPVTREDCKQKRDDLYDRVLPALRPDVVVAMNFPYDQPRQLVPYLGPDGNVPRPNSPQFRGWLRTTTVHSVEEIEALGARVVVIEPIPYRPDDFDPLVCLSSATVVEECRYVTSVEPTLIERIYRRLDDDDQQLWSVDVDRLVCPFLPICDPIVDGRVVKMDASHLTASFARSLAPALGAYLYENGIVE